MNNNNPYYDSRAQNGYGSGWYGQPGMNNQYDLNIVRQPTSNFGYNGNQGYGRRRR